MAITFYDSFKTLKNILFNKKLSIQNIDWSFLNMFSYEAILTSFFFYPKLFMTLNKKYNNLDLYCLDKKELVLQLRKIITKANLSSKSFNYCKRAKEITLDFPYLGYLPEKEKQLLFDIILKNAKQSQFESIGLLHEDVKRLKKEDRLSSKKFLEMCKRKYSINNINNFFDSLPFKTIDNLNYIYDTNITDSNFNIRLNLNNYDEKLLYVDHIYFFINCGKKINIYDVINENINSIILNIEIKPTINFEKISEYIIDTTRAEFDLKEHEYSIIDSTNMSKIKEKVEKSSSTIFDRFRFDQVENTALATNKVYSIRIPEKYYSKNMRLLDVQKNKNSLIYIFRDINDKKHILKTNMFNYYYKIEGYNNTSYPVTKPDGLVTYKKCFKLPRVAYDLYEHNITPDIRHIVDYHYIKGDEATLFSQQNIKISRAYWDIEIDTSIYIDINDTLNSADSPITYISYISDKEEKHVWIYQKDINFTKKTVDGANIHFFKTEEEMLDDFFTFLNIQSPDILAAWNAPFDVSYTYTRVRLYYPKLLNKMSKYGSLSIYKTKTYTSITWPGYIIVDLCEYYKKQAREELESYKLGFVADIELEQLEKLEMPGPDDPIEKWIKYNLRDSEILYELDYNKLDLIGFRENIINDSKCCWKKNLSSSYVIIGFVHSLYKKRGLVVRHSKVERITEMLKGGFNQFSASGILNFLVDLDAKSMYPSIMRNFNIGWDTMLMKIPPEYAFKALTQRDILTDEELQSNFNAWINPFVCDLQGNVKIVTTNLKKVLKFIRDRKAIITFNGGIYQCHEEGYAITFEVLNDLNNKRDIVKSEVYDENGKLVVKADNRQKSLKELANSFYGICGLDIFPLSHADLINSVTYSGRFLIKSTMVVIDYYLTHKKTNENYNVEDITDSEIIDLMRQIKIDPQSDLGELKYAIYADTDGTMICFQDFVDNADDCYKYIKDIVHLTNKRVIPIVYQMCNVSQDNPKHLFLKFKDEWIARRAILYDKVCKKYCVYITSKHQKTVDEIEIRKNIVPVSIPKISRDYLTDLLENYILRKDEFSIDDVWDRINEVTDEIKKLIFLKSKKIAKPVGLTKRIHQFKKEFIPEHVNGMLWYNHLCKKSFDGFQRGYLYKIKGFDPTIMPKNVLVKYNKLLKDNFKINLNDGIYKLRPNTFVTTTDEDLPDWVVLDEKTILNSLWISRYENAIEPLSKVVMDKLDFSF